MMVVVVVVECVCVVCRVVPPQISCSAFWFRRFGPEGLGEPTMTALLLLGAGSGPYSRGCKSALVLRLF